MAYRILVDPNAIPQALEYLRSHGYELKRQSSRSEEGLREELQDCDAYLMQEGTCGPAVLEHVPRLKVIGKESVGLDMIDLDCAQRLGIWVTNARGANTRSVAEHTMALILACAKSLVTMDGLTRRGEWPRQERPTLDLYHKTLGIVGFGAIGAETARMAHDGFGMEILGYDVGARPELRARYPFADELDELLKTCDYLSLHVPLTKQTCGMIGERELSLMKPSAFLINCARGAVVDKDALTDALKARLIRGAALDAFDCEPLPPNDPLARLDNVILSPHNAAFTEDTIVRMWMCGASGIHEVLSGHIPSLPGNHPPHPRMPLGDHP